MYNNTTCDTTFCVLHSDDGMCDYIRKRKTKGIFTQCAMSKFATCRILDENIAFQRAKIPPSKVIRTVCKYTLDPFVVVIFLFSDSNKNIFCASDFRVFFFASFIQVAP